MWQLFFNQLNLFLWKKTFFYMSHFDHICVYVDLLICGGAFQYCHEMECKTKLSIYTRFAY